MTLPLPLDCHDAVFSDDGLYRYELRRTWGDGPPVLWLMLNPSTADAVEDDPTVRRCMRFARAWERYGGIIVCNLFALRSTDPAGLQKVDDPVGPDNDKHIDGCAQEAGLVVCAWGNHGYYKGRAMDVSRRLIHDGFVLWCFGVSKHGCHPLHPLYLPKTSRLMQFEGYESWGSVTP
jgi:hypothetical protein